VTDSPADKFAELDAIIASTDLMLAAMRGRPRLHAVDAGADGSAPIA